MDSCAVGSKFHLLHVTLPNYNPFLTGFHLSSAIKHFVVFFVFGSLMCLLVYSYRSKYTQTGIIAFASAGLYSVTDEVQQYFTPTRYATIEDIAVNVIGVACGIVVVVLLHKLWRRLS